MGAILKPPGLKLQGKQLGTGAGTQLLAARSAALSASWLLDLWQARRVHNAASRRTGSRSGPHRICISAAVSSAPGRLS